MRASRQRSSTATFFSIANRIWRGVRSLIRNGPNWNRLNQIVPRLEAARLRRPADDVPANATTRVARSKEISPDAETRGLAAARGHGESSKIVCRIRQGQ